MMKNYFDFTGKTAVVTGGRRGLGRAMALALAGYGAQIAIISKSQDADDVIKDVAKLGRECFYIQADLENKKERTGLMKQIQERFGRLDILINNAGYLHCSPVLDYPMNQWEKDMSTLLDAPFDLSQQAGKIMRKQKSGKIIQIASTAAYKEGANLIAYATAKNALLCMTRCLASSLAQFNINVNAIAPGIFNTDINTALFKNSEALERRCKQVPSGRLGDVEDIVGPMLFLASDQSKHVHGQTLIVDGGFTIN